MSLQIILPNPNKNISFQDHIELSKKGSKSKKKKCCEKFKKKGKSSCKSCPTLFA